MIPVAEFLPDLPAYQGGAGEALNVIASSRSYRPFPALVAYSTTPGMLNLTAGILTGVGIGGSSFTVVIAAFGKLMPTHMRTLAFGVGTAAGSFGQFLFSPLAVAFIDLFGWQHA